MSILSHHTSRTEAAAISRSLRRETYQVTAETCYGYVATVIERVAGMDPGDQREVRRIIEREIGTVEEE